MIKSKVRYFFFMLCTGISPLLGLSQSQTHSPYSQYGVGDPVRTGFVNSFAMGGANRWMSDEFMMNPNNPATYSNLRSTVYDVGLFYNTTQGQTGDVIQESDNAGLRYFGLGFPVSDRLGWGMGITPYSEMGYDFTSPTNVGSTTANTRYTGLGGLSKIHGGLSWEAVKDSANRLSVGANLLYFMGPVEQTTSVAFTGAQAQQFNSVITREMRTSDVNFDVGVHYKKDITKLFTKKKANRIYLNLGASFMPQAQLNMNRTQTAFSSRNQPKDVVREQRDTTDLTLPMEYGFGGSIEVTNINKKNRFIIGFNYDHIDWQSLSIGGSNEELSGSHVYSAGMQYTPNEQALRGLFKLMRYRLGARYADTRIVIDDNQLSDFAVTGGFSVPLTASRSITTLSTTLNFGVEYGVRGGGAEFTENYTRFMLGLSITPSFWDKWFQKRRIN